MKCNGRHTAFQPDGVDWACPRCGGHGSDFYIDSSEEGTASDCDRLHAGDIVYCEGCSSEWTGIELVIEMQQARKFVVCPKCQGTGKIRKEDA